MKKTLLISLLLSLTTSLMASNWMPHSKILAESNEAHQLESSCKSISGETCYDVADYPSKVYSEKILKKNIESCDDGNHCQEILESKICPSGEPIKNLDSMDVYCTEKVIVLDEAKQLLYLEEQNQKAIAAQIESFKAVARSMRDCGNGVLDLMFVRNAQKGLSTAQVKQFMANNSSIQSFLSGGALESAKEEIQATEADGVLVTESDKAALVAEIDKCLIGNFN